MSEATSNPRLWSFARACRRLADEIAPDAGAVATDPQELESIVEYLRAAAERLGELAGAAAELPGGLVESALTNLLEPQESTPAGDPPSEEHEQLLQARGGFATTADMVSFLSAARHTGTLEIVTELECFELEFQDGDIVHAQSDGTPVGDRLGDVLVEQGAVERDRLEAVLRADPGDRLGLALWQQGVVTHRQLVGALEEQIRRQFARMFELQPLQFTFWSGPPMRAQKQLRMSATGLILDGARAADERNRTE